MPLGRVLPASLQVSRRAVLGAGLAASAAIFIPGLPRPRPGWWVEAAAALPGSLPDPSRPAGTRDLSIPIDHIVVVMMENHSFDNYLGMLPRRGHAGADGFSFDASGRPSNSNATTGGRIRAFHMPTVCQMESSPSQAWDATHVEIDGGRMDGFVRAPGNGDVGMGYWDEVDIPYYYSLARTFSLANRWFASCPGQTYPNRRYLMAATSYGLVNTVLPSPTDAPPPNGTIFDRLDAHGISWANYYSDLPQTALIPAVVSKSPQNLRPVASFATDAALGQLPFLSLVDPDFGLTDALAGQIPGQPVPEYVRAQGLDEENPQDIRLGEQFVAQIVNAAITGKNWDRTLLIWLYDEHGGYYDHVPVPSALPPDGIGPQVAATDPYRAYDSYGVRVPAVVVSPYARSGMVSGVVHDHTSILRMAEVIWNLPALTFRDANATDLRDLLDLAHPPSLLVPPALAPAASPIGDVCSTADPNAPVEALAPGGGPSGPGVSNAGSSGSGSPNTVASGAGDGAGAAAASLALSAGLAAWARRRARRRPPGAQAAASTSSVAATDAGSASRS